MRALITKGKFKGEKVTISQWCNDWFSTMDGKILSPSQLAFTEKDIQTIKKHKNNGMMFAWYEIVSREKLSTFKKINQRLYPNR